MEVWEGGDSGGIDAGRQQKRCETTDMAFGGNSDGVDALWQGYHRVVVSPFCLPMYLLLLPYRVGLDF